MTESQQFGSLSVLVRRFLNCESEYFTILHRISWRGSCNHSFYHRVPFWFIPTAFLSTVLFAEIEQSFCLNLDFVGNLMILNNLCYHLHPPVTSRLIVILL